MGTGLLVDKNKAFVQKNPIGFAIFPCRVASRPVRCYFHLLAKQKRGLAIRKLSYQLIIKKLYFCTRAFCFCKSHVFGIA
jgi:hypothetical protein